MNRVSTFAAALAVLPAIVSAQAPPRPPRPAAPPAPVAPAPVAPPAVVAALPPADVLWAPLAPLAPLPEIGAVPMVAPLAFDRLAVEEAMQAAREAVIALPRIEVAEAMDAARAAMAGLDVEAIAREARETAQAVVAGIDHAALADQVREVAQAQAAVAWDAHGLAPFEYSHLFERTMSHGYAFESQSPDSSAYNSAMSALNSRQYDNAVTRFDRVIVQKGAHADAALYWKAFSLFKLGRSADALEAIAQLRRDHAQSAYVKEARVLEADVKRSSGQPVNPAATDDDDIKLLAISGIQKSDPERAIPLLEGVLNATNSLAVKRRALYVLALSDQPRAHEILMSYAKGAGTPDLQRVAIEYIASRRDRQTTAADLREIYNSTNDIAVKMAIISAYREAGDKNSLIAIVNNTGAPIALRTSAVSGLTRLASPQDVWALYQKETDPALRRSLLSALSSMQASDLLIQAARSERDAVVRRQAVSYLGRQRAEVTGQTLVDLYAAEQDVEVRKGIISALTSQTNAEGLVAIARRENSLELTREIVSRLSNMAAKSKVAADYLMEIIKR